MTDLTTAAPNAEYSNGLACEQAGLSDVQRVAAAAAYAELVNNPGLNLEPFERRCAILWAECQDPDQIARAVWPDEFEHLEQHPSRQKRQAILFDLRRRVRFALQKVAQKLAAQEPQMREASVGFRADVLNALRNSRCSGRTPQTYTGVKPYGALDDEALATRRSAEDYRKALQDPHNYQEVSLRGPLVTAHDLPRLPAAEKLLHLVSHCAAQVELAAASV